MSDSRMLIVIDMLRGFCEEGHPLYCGPASREIIPRIADKISEYDAARQPVLFLCDRHQPDDPEFEMFPPHCLEGTVEAEIVPELAGLATNEIRVPKNRFSGFVETPLPRILEERQPELVEVCGVCTNICVLYTVQDLRARYYRVSVLREMVASFDPEAHAFALGQMESVLGATLA